MLFQKVIEILVCQLLILYATVHNTFPFNNYKALLYLKRYGYILPECDQNEFSCKSRRLTFDSKLKDFQEQFRLPITGELDDATKKLMNQPRCGLPDRDRFSLFGKHTSNDIKWEKQELTWSFRDKNEKYNRAIEQAFQKWKEIIPQFTFRQVCSTCNADIFLSFQSRVHSRERYIKDNQFNEGVLAHAYYPKDGTINFSNQVKWTDSFDHNNEMFNFYLVAVHEIGHALGYMYKGNVHNTDDSTSIMYPIYSNLNKENLFSDADQKAMHEIYLPEHDPNEIYWEKDDWAYGCDFKGNDLSSVHILADQCGSNCFRTHNCTHFTWTEDNNGTCWMKQNSVSKRDAIRTTKDTTICGIVHSNIVNWDGKQWAHGCDFPGKDLNNRRTTPDQCGPICVATQGCTHYTWTTYNNGTCWMKQGNVSKSDAISNNSQSMVCGIVGPITNEIDWNGNSWALGCDFSGRDLISIPTLVSNCGPECEKSDKCTHFTWTPDNSGTCWMKQGPISKSNAFPTGNRSMVCGVVVRIKHENGGKIIWKDNSANACDFNTRDLFNIKTKSTRCNSICTRTKDCTHYTWNTFNGGTCWMKTGSVTKDDAFITNDEKMICGIINSK